jgi:hypothetical protein
MLTKIRLSLFLTPLCHGVIELVAHEFNHAMAQRNEEKGESKERKGKEMKGTCTVDNTCVYFSKFIGRCVI